MSFVRRIPPSDGRYVAARALDFGDWKVAEGELFPWKEHGLDARDVQRRWWSGELESEADWQRTHPPAAPAVVPAPATPPRAGKRR